MSPTTGVQTFLTRDSGRRRSDVIRVGPPHLKNGEITIKHYKTGMPVKWCDEAGLPEHCVPHGLRKSFTCRLMEAGAEVGDVAAAGGWTSLARVQHYAKDYDRKKASRRAMAKLAAHSATQATAESA